jgi:hypothetical protein
MDRNNLKDQSILAEILESYGIEVSAIKYDIISSGLINKTWKITGANNYILQQLNHHVFVRPYEVDENIKRIGYYLAERQPEYLYVNPLPNRFGQTMINRHDCFYRLFPFMQNTHTINTVSSPSEAYEAANQFGIFAKNLAGFDTAQLNITIYDFHNLSLRYEQFRKAITEGNKERIDESKDLIQRLNRFIDLLVMFEKIEKEKLINKKVTHHDTKISNVLFDNGNRGVCVIDLDTVMPGYFISDFGDMMRTYLSPVNEEENDFSLIEIREEYFTSIAEGYFKNVINTLTEVEKQFILYSGSFLTYMQALRFLADYCNNDVYYGSRYEGQNFVRATNQVVLLEKMHEKEGKLREILTSTLKY